MEIIKQLSEQIDDELDDAHKYIKKALKEKEKYPQIADVYYRLSNEEMSHVDLLHGAAVAKINEIRQTQEVPPAMQAVYDYLHQKQIDKAAKIKAKQAEYAK